MKDYNSGPEPSGEQDSFDGDILLTAAQTRPNKLWESSLGNVHPKNIHPLKDSPLKKIHSWKIFTPEKYSPYKYSPYKYSPFENIHPLEILIPGNIHP